MSTQNETNRHEAALPQAGLDVKLAPELVAATIRMADATTAAAAAHNTMCSDVIYWTPWVAWAVIAAAVILVAKPLLENIRLELKK